MKVILVIEDQAAMRRNLATILEMEGYRPLVAETGARGIELAIEHRPDLILCDIMMPGVDGYAVLRCLRSQVRTAAIPFVFLSAKAERADFRTGMNLGADDYLSKPVSRRDLLRALELRFEHEHRIEARIREGLGKVPFCPDFTTHVPLVRRWGLSVRESEVLLWVAQGKSNDDVATILGMSEKTVKKHLGRVFDKLGVESRTAATLRALEALHEVKGEPAEASEPGRRD
ncbi:MAG: response regulator transcription factor [Verrucomicrobiales bacterium]|nr:response regulator transcription factor [Verrucomicrobiales bacterium]